MSAQQLSLLVIAVTTIWVAYDASERDWRNHRFANRTWKWVVCCLLLWIVAFPMYLVHRSRVPSGP